MNTRKQHPHVNIRQSRIILTDDMGGHGLLEIKELSPRFVPNPNPRPAYPPFGGFSSPAYHAYCNWTAGHIEYDDFAVQGVDFKDCYYPNFALKDYGNGVILPASVAAGTKFKTKAAAAEFADRWIAAGCPGIGLESAAEYQRRMRDAASAYAVGKAAYWFSQMTDTDLVRVSEMALDTISRRAEKEAKAAATRAAKAAKATAKAEAAKAKAEAQAAKVKAKAEAAKAKAEAQAAKAAKVRAKAEAQAAKGQGLKATDSSVGAI